MKRVIQMMCVAVGVLVGLSTSRVHAEYWDWRGAGTGGETATDPSDPTTLLYRAENWLGGGVPLARYSYYDTARVKFTNAGRINAQSCILNGLYIGGTTPDADFSIGPNVHLETAALLVGWEGFGSVVQTAGQLTTNVLRVSPGLEENTFGSYRLVDGILSAYRTDLGDFHGGTFIQLGGTHAVGSYLQINGGQGVTGVYELHGGLLQEGVGPDYIGFQLAFSGHSIFRQYGGTHNIAGKMIMSQGGGEALYELHDGSLSVGSANEYTNEFVGKSGLGTFQQTGGHHSVVNDLILGHYSWATGIFEISGGTLDVSKTLQVSNEGSGTLKVIGDGAAITTTSYVQGTLGTLLSEIGSDGISSISVTDAAQLAGSWTVEDLGGAPFDKFDILHADGGIYGGFGSVILPNTVDWDWGIDNGTTLWVEHVPEPATLGMLALGGLAVIRRRKRGGFKCSREGKGRAMKSVIQIVCVATLALIGFVCPSLSHAESWNIEIVDSAGHVGPYSSLAVDASGRPHIAYLDGDHTKVKYATFDGSSWNLETVDGGGHWTGGTGYISMALDGLGNPRMAYYSSADDALRYAAYDGASWQIDNVVINHWGPQYMSLALDSSGNPHISYFDPTFDDLMYAVHDGVSWQIRTVASTGIVGHYSALALDSLDRPRIAYGDATWGNYKLKYAKLDGSYWQFYTVADAPPSFISHVIDASGKSHISYKDAGMVDLKYATFETSGGGSSTSITVVDDEGSTGGGSSITLDGSGNPHISYSGDNNDLRYARFNGSSWEIEIVDSDAWAALTSLALDPAGNPHISYWDPRATTLDLRYAYVPEPATLSLLALGALAVLRRRSPGRRRMLRRGRRRR